MRILADSQDSYSEDLMMLKSYVVKLLGHLEEESRNAQALLTRLWSKFFRKKIL